ncbi:helix-turn-helix domain-containing protein (plasmid) [Streptomycetaceae bacterium NBC_01309]
MASLTFRDLMAAGALETGELISGAAGLDRAVVGVTILEDQPDASHNGTAAVLELPRRQGAVVSTYLVDVMLRRLHAVGGSGLVICRAPSDVFAAASRRLADRLSMPMVVVEKRTCLDVASDLRLWIRQPDLQSAWVLCEVARTLHSSASSLSGITDALARALNAEVSVLSAQGTAMTGPDLGDALSSYLTKPAPITGVHNGISFAALPHTGESGEPELWLVAQSRQGGVLWRDRAALVLSLGEAYVSSWLSNRVVAAERDARFRATLLGEILSFGGAVPAGTAALAARIGWRLSGWHTGVYFLRLSRTKAFGTAIADLERLMADVGVAMGPLVERSDGWSGWISADRPPSPHEGAGLVANVSAALHRYAARIGTAPVVAGIGRAALGPAGLTTTLSEARHAALGAAVAHVPGGVQHVDSLGAAQVLMASCASPALRESARTLLAPLLAESFGDDLLRTLEAFLDAGGSTTQAARRLNLHRNTVMQRVDRACEVLGITRDDADERLAIQLACRAYRLER